MRERAYLTNHGHEAFAGAHELADQLGHDVVTAAHLAVGIIQGMGLGAAVLHVLNVPIEDLDRELRSLLPPQTRARSTAGPPLFSEELDIVDAAETVLRTPAATTKEYAWTPTDEVFVSQARDIATEIGNPYYGSEHLLLALVKDDTSRAAEVFNRYGVHRDSTIAAINRILAG